MLLPDLIAKLEALHGRIQNTLGDRAADETEVRLATNPTWPMQHVIAEDRDLVWTVEPESDYNEQQVVAYLPDGGQATDNPYLPGQVAAALGFLSS